MLTAAAINFTSTPIRKRKESLPDFRKTDLTKDSAEELAEFTNVTLEDYEVMRPPTKKIKKFHIEQHNNVSTGCYSNPALDLNAQDRTFNPFEVMRTDVITSNKGFSNPAFDIEKENEERTQGQNFNPHVSLFEVFRKEKEFNDTKGIDNYALELNSPEHKPLLLALPFQPTVNHRIDFSNYPNLVPLQHQQLQKEEAVAVKNVQQEETSAEHLSIIREEESEVDIGQELDNYQLELENSMNEAKIKKMFDAESPKSNGELTESGIKSQPKLEVETGCNDLKESQDDDVQFEEVDSFEDYGNFKRAYRKEKVNQVVDEATKKSSSNFPSDKKRFTTIVRNSVRKLIKSKSSKQTQTKESHETKENNHHLGLIQSIRQSLRKKNRNQNKLAVSSPNPNLTTICENRRVFKEIETTSSKMSSIQTADTLVKIVKLDIKTKKTFQENVEIFNNL